MGAALVAFAIVGWYRGWYQVTTDPEPGGHREVKIDINGPKIGKDVHQGAQKLEHAVENKFQGTGAGAPTAPTAPPAAQLPPAGTAAPGGGQFVTPAGFGTAYPAPENEAYVLPPTTPAPTTPRPYPN